MQSHIQQGIVRDLLEGSVEISWLKWSLLIQPCIWQALLKKHEAFMADLEAYRSVIEDLRDQAQVCKVRTVPTSRVLYSEKKQF